MGTAPDLPADHPRLIRMRTFSRRMDGRCAGSGYSHARRHLITAFGKVRNPPPPTLDNPCCPSGRPRCAATANWLAHFKPRFASRTHRISQIAILTTGDVPPSASNSSHRTAVLRQLCQAVLDGWCAARVAADMPRLAAPPMRPLRHHAQAVARPENMMLCTGPCRVSTCAGNRACIAARPQLPLRPHLCTAPKERTIAGLAPRNRNSLSVAVRKLSSTAREPPPCVYGAIHAAVYAMHRRTLHHPAREHAHPSRESARVLQTCKPPRLHKVGVEFGWTSRR